MSSILDSLFGKKQATEGKPLLNKKSPEVLQFKQMVEEINNSDQVLKCVDFYITRFGNFYDREGLIAGDIKHEVTKVIELYKPLFNDSFNDKVKYIYGLAFLERAACLYHSDYWEKHLLLDIMYDIIHTNKDELIQDALPYIKEISSDKNLLRIIFAGNHIVTFWNEVIAKESKVNKQIASYFIEAAFKQTDLIILQLKEFLDNAIVQISGDVVPPEMLPVGLHLIGALIANISAEQYIQSIFNVLDTKINSIVSYEWFAGFLLTRSLNQNIAWQKLQFVIMNNDATTRQMCTAVDALYFVRTHPRVKNFELIPFTRVFPNMPFETQTKLYEIALNHNLKERILIFHETYPFWERNINTEALSKFVINANWGNKGYKELISVLESLPFDPLVAALIKDVHTFNIVASIFSHLDPEWPKINDFLEAVLNGTLEESRHPQELAKIVLPQFDPHIFIETVKKYFDRDVLNVAVLELIAEYAENSLDFTHAFCETGGLDKLTKHLSCPQTLDIIRAFVRDEPYNLVDEYIARTDFSQIPKDKITHLMCGTKQSENLPKSQFIRIPSLCKYVQPMLDYAYNRYIYGKYAPLYFTPPEGDIFESSRTYMNSEVAAKFMTSPKSISYLIQNMEPCTGVYQLNHDCPNHSHPIKCEGVTSFWIFVHKFEGKSTMFTIDDKFTVFFENGNICLHKSALTLKFKEWHLITFQMKTVEDKKAMSVYFDMEELRTVETDSDTITLGGETAPNGHWYIGEFFTNKVTMTTKYLSEVMDKGPSKVSTKLQTPFVYVPYAGPLSYLPAFGGPDTFWSACFNSKEIDEFLELILAAFSLERSKIITTEDLFNGIAACAIQVPHLMIEQTGQIAVMESMKQLRTTSPMLTHLFQNYFFANAPDMLHQLFLSTYSELKDPVAILPYLTDSLIFFNITGARLENTLEAIGMIMKKKPEETIKFMLDILRGMPFINSMKVETPDDPQITELQTELMRRVFGAGFPKKAEDCLEPLDTLSSCIAPYVFNGFVKNSIQIDGFFSQDILNKMYPALAFYSDKELVWQGIFSLINNQVLKKMSDFKTDLIARPNIVILAYDLACELLRKDLNSKLASTVLQYLLGIERNADVLCPNLHVYVSKLCAAGFHYYEKMSIPFSIYPDETKYVNDEDISGLSVNYSNEKDFVDIDDAKYEYTIERKPKKEDDKARKLDGQTDICRIIADMSSLMLNLKCNDANLFKDLLVKNTIQGADVPQPVSKEMHIFLLYDFLMTKPKLVDVSKSVLCDFVSTVVFSGWWKNYEQPLLAILFDYLPPEPINFMTVCMLSINSPRIIMKLLQTPVAWKKCQKSKNFMDYFAEKLSQYEFTEDQEKLILKELSNPLKKNFQNKTMKEYLTQDKLDSAEIIKKQTQNYINQLNQDIISKRLNSSLKTPSNVFEISRNGNAFLHRISLRNQFATRFNKCCMGAEENICHVYQTRVLLEDFNLNEKGKITLLNSPSPIYPAKNLLPLPEKSEENKVNDLNLNFRPYFTPKIEYKSLNGILLPPYLNSEKEEELKRSLTNKLHSNEFVSFEIILDHNLPCVGAFAEDKFVFVLNAKVTEKGIEILENKGDKIIDMSISGLLGRSSLFFHSPSLEINKKEVTFVETSKLSDVLTLVDIFLFDGKHFSFSVNNDIQDDFVNKIKPEKPVLPQILEMSSSDILKGYSDGTITTLDLLFYANKKAGKSYSDRDNYPLFPLIKSDGSMNLSEIDLTIRKQFVNKLLNNEFSDIKSAINEAEKSLLTPEFYIPSEISNEPKETIFMRSLLEKSDISEWVDSIFGPESSTRVFDSKMPKPTQRDINFDTEYHSTVLVPQPYATRVKSTKAGCVFLSKDQYMLQKAMDIDDFLVEHSLKNISALAVSEDSTAIAAATAQGTILVYFAVSNHSKLITCPKAVMTSMSLDTKSNSLLATDGEYIYLFDIPSAVLAKKVKCENVVSLALFSVEDLLIAITKTKAIVFNNDLVQLSELAMESEPTCLSTIEGPMFEEKPRFVIGFVNGEVSSFAFDIQNCSCQKVLTYQKEGLPVKSVTSLHHGKAIIALDNEGGATSFTAKKCPKFADVSLFIKCTGCDKEAAWLCRDCGRAFCGGCLVGGKCPQCRQMSGHFQYFEKKE
ncbi:hypothetical protein TVAG_270930 [Trichomonas vaginalis G3]|uniref:Beige/BEACH domain containing protein n=1 Tax=Trichomonas vaginalis (strain ATCC PRA-98 / G3) TaxID=412133 RepID=A2FII5_TRIV3|nr:aggrephagy protein [Trichomonas vaginalis G3]EAX95302.1 hypothetical protein TVAG_270930 [Trichomonas vaginalis G3]KAI5539356.1 aggrephagy protein [Trichomonas vaginalis G3]|eukprot:XP_001308232.1 hypothetical protein [Trichomonas vaginalis G3]